jgi:hypothetical protein
MFGLIIIGFVFWAFWSEFTKEKRALKKHQKKTAGIIEKNNQEWQKAKLQKENRIKQLEQIIFQKYTKAKNIFPFISETMTHIPYGFDENIAEYLKLIEYKQDIYSNNTEFRKIIEEYHGRQKKQAAEGELLSKQKAIKEQQERDLKIKLEKERALEEEKRETEERYKNMTAEELESAAIFWYELQAEIRRGK